MGISGILLTFLPQSVRNRMRRMFDRLFCAHGVSVARVGGESAWFILAGRMRAGANILSGGAGNDISFEVELAVKYGCRVAIFDPSPTGAATFQKLSPVPSGLMCHLHGLAGATTDVVFSAPKDPVEGSFTTASGEGLLDKVTFKCLSPKDALRVAGFDGLELLKLDIEGFEYEFLRAAMRDGLRPAQIAVEFHHFFKEVSICRTLGMIRLLRRHGYRLVHKNRYDYLFVQEGVLTSLALRPIIST